MFEGVLLTRTGQENCWVGHVCSWSNGIEVS